MVSTNDKNQSSRKPAENYGKRARVVIERTLMVWKEFSDPDKWQEPTEANMETLIDNFHGVLNWGLLAAFQGGFPVMCFSGLLDEDDMRCVEKYTKRICERILRKVILFGIFQLKYVPMYVNFMNYGNKTKKN